MTEKLKECPFCNGPGVEVAFEYISCGGAHDCPGKGVRAEDAEDWNTRATGWQTIESAPKDGTLILISGTITGSWHGRGPRPTPEPFIGTAYFAHGLWQTGQLSGPPDPTHWMPLPPTQGEG